MGCHRALRIGSRLSERSLGQYARQMATEGSAGVDVMLWVDLACNRVGSGSKKFSGRKFTRQDTCCWLGQVWNVAHTQQRDPGIGAATCFIQTEHSRYPN